MRLTTVLLMASLMQVSAAGFAQKISLSEKNASLDKVLDKIYAQSGFDFIINAQLLRNAKPVNINVSNIEIKDVLLKIFEDQVLDFEIQQKMVVVRNREPSLIDKLVARFQEIEVTGKVVDEKGQPISGATIKVKDRKIMTTTNDQGVFVLRNIPQDAMIEIYSLGYKTKVIQAIKETGTLVLDILIGDLTEVNIVSTGYQTLPKERATGSFTKIDNKLFNEQISTDILSRLEAVANGVSFNRTTLGASGLIIRGLSTISGPKQPLIVVDNFPYEGDLNNLNPNDVENITILKDAAASSIWGTRAGNGVVVITTKKGSQNQKLQLESISNVTIAEKPDLFYIPQLSSSQYIEIEKMLFANKYRFADTSSTRYLPFTPVYELLFQQMKGRISKTTLEEKLALLSTIDVRNEFTDHMYRNMLNQQYALNIRGGNNVATYYFSSGYDRNISNLYSGYDRINLNIQNTYNPLKAIKLSSGIRFTQSSSSSGRTAYGVIRSQDLPPYIQFTDPSGNFLPITRAYRQTYIDTVGKGKLLDWKYYMDDYRKTNTTAGINDILVNLGANFTVTKWLKADLIYQYENQNTSSNMLNAADSYFTRNLVNQYSQINQAAGTVKYIVPKGGILDQGKSKLSSQSLRGQLNVDQQWGRHQLAILTGAELRDQSLDGNNNRTYGYDPNILTFANVDLTNTYPSIINGARTFIPDLSDFTGTSNRFISGFINGSYTFDNRFVVSGSARKDASNLFGVNTNDKWNLLWSAGAAWNISNEKRYKLDWLPYLKLRATYGYSGNVDLSRSAVTTVWFPETSPYTLLPIGRFSQFGNPELRWEKVGMSNIAVDFAGKHNRVSGSLDFFWKSASDLFSSIPIDYTAGTLTTMVKNAASMKGKGMDLSLNTLNLTGKVKWNSSLNLSFYNDKLTKRYVNAFSGSNYVTSATPNSLGVVGKPLYSVFSYKWKGLDPQNGDPIGFINGHNSKNYNAITGDSTKLEDLVFSGSALPTVYGSLGNTFSYQNFSLTVRILYNFGYYYRRAAISYTTLFASNTGGHPEYADRWQKPGDELITNVPSMVYPGVANRDNFYNSSEATVEKGDHIRLQYINLGYDINNNTFKRLPFKNLRCYVNISNLGILWAANKEGIDPEYRRSSLPPAKTVSLGLNLTY